MHVTINDIATERKLTEQEVYNLVYGNKHFPRPSAYTEKPKDRRKMLFKRAEVAAFFDTVYHANAVHAGEIDADGIAKILNFTGHHVRKLLRDNNELIKPLRVTQRGKSIYSLKDGEAFAKAMKLRHRGETRKTEKRHDPRIKIIKSDETNDNVFNRLCKTFISRVSPERPRLLRTSTLPPVTQTVHCEGDWG